MKKLLFVAAIVLAACGGKSTRDTLKPGQKQHVRLDPVNPKAMLDFEAAMRAMRLGGPEASETAKGRLKDAIEKDKNLWEAWHNLGIIALRDGDDAVAVDAFDHALAINKDHNESLLARAEAATSLDPGPLDPRACARAEILDRHAAIVRGERRMPARQQRLVGEHHVRRHGPSDHDRSIRMQGGDPQSEARVVEEQLAVRHVRS